MQTSVENKFWQFDCSYWFEKLNSSDKGLSQSKAASILLTADHHQKKDSGFKKDVKLFAGQFKSPLMLLLIGAVILSAFLGDTSDVFIILFIVLSTGLLSFFQERKAGRVVEKLQSMISLKSSVLRDGRVQEIDSKNIVAGDVLVFNAGDMIPADCLLIDNNELHANEASLTGESYPVRKEAGKLDPETELSKRINTLWEGTNVVSGNARALVIQTGNNTIFGSIAQSASKNTETTFEKGIKDFGFFLMKITLSLSVFILVINLINHKSPIESALFALALAVGMAPELLPAITTIAMSAGAKRMLIVPGRRKQNLPGGFTQSLPLMENGTIGTAALAARTKPPRLNGSSALPTERVPSGKMISELPSCNSLAHCASKISGSSA